ncbi:MAG: hypothetical protein M3235_14855, partial [Actinomycetota bacterium]|nr:hypothetical protein [Actinomycetota bacterium]
LPWGWAVPLVAAVLVALAALAVRAGVDVFLPKYRTRPESTLAALRRRWQMVYLRILTPKGRFARIPDMADEVPTAAVAVTPWPAAADRQGRDGRRAGRAALLGMAIAVLFAWITAVNGMGPADSLSQTYDAVFHYSAVAHIVGSGDASSLTLGTLTNPMSAAAFYPGAWHDLVSLAVLSTGVGVMPATNATALAVAAVVWPLGCLFLARQVLGRSSGAALVTPVLAVGFTAFPWNLMAFGVLWPNLLAVALLPGSLAAVVTLMGLARDSTIGRQGAAALVVVALPTLTLAHPNAVFSLAVLGLFPILWGVGVLFRRRFLSRRFWQPILALAVVAGLVWAAFWLMTASPLTEGVRSFDWKAFETPGESVWAVLTNGMNNRQAAWTISVLVLVGAVFSVRRTSTSWLLPAHLGSGFLYLEAASTEGEFTEAVTGAWYNDSTRLAAMVPVTGTVLAVIGLLGLARLLRRKLPAGYAAAGSRRPAPPAVTAAAVTLLALAISGGMHQQVHATVLAGPYRSAGDLLLEPGQREFLQRVAQQIPPDAVVAANPWTGNSLLYALTGREVLFPHLNGNWTPEQRLVAEHMRDAPFDPNVCAAVAATRTSYVITGPVTFWPWNGGTRQYFGLDFPPGALGFDLLDDDGRNKLYRITACDTIDATTNP